MNTIPQLLQINARNNYYNDVMYMNVYVFCFSLVQYPVRSFALNQPKTDFQHLVFGTHC